MGREWGTEESGSKLQMEKKPEKNREEKKMGWGPGRPSGENRGRRRENGKNGMLASVLLGEEKKKEKCGRRSVRS